MKKFFLSSILVSFLACQNQVNSIGSKNNLATEIKQENTFNSKPENENIIKPINDFKLLASDFTDGGLYPKNYTCDGTSSSPSLSWVNPPSGTVAYAITMHHIPGPGDEHVYMVVYDIPSNINTFSSNEKNLGIWGINTVNRKNEYAPPCSKGPGPKVYTLTLYALSSKTTLKNTSNITKNELIQDIKDKTLATSSINITYSRS
ncbi:MAG: YbhB/YbcL family Raf kinase inhibitor-like protein [Candidatus Sericytochromatia bacterium]